MNSLNYEIYRGDIRYLKVPRRDFLGYIVVDFAHYEENHVGVIPFNKNELVPRYYRKIDMETLAEMSENVFVEDGKYFIFGEERNNEDWNRIYLDIPKDVKNSSNNIRRRFVP